MRLTLCLLAPLVLWGEEPPRAQSGRPPAKAEAQASRQQKPAKVSPVEKPGAVSPVLLPPEKSEPVAAPGTPAKKSGLDSVEEMRVESTTRGISRQGEAGSKKDPGIHGEVRGTGGAAGRASSGTAVVQDKKDGKWAVTVSGDSVKGKR